MEYQWNFSVNVFETSTRNNFHNALKISIHLNGALSNQSTDPFFGPLNTYYNVRHLAYNTAFDNWLIEFDEQQSKTVALENLLRTLSRIKIRQWDVAIQNIHGLTTPEYKYLLPNRRAPFQNGKQIDIIAAVKNLGEKLTGDTALATTKTDVDNYYTQLNAAFSMQKASIAAVAALSDTLELERINMCNAQYYILGQLMSHFYLTPNSICSYFDLETMRKKHQVYYTGHINPLVTKNICKHTFHAGDKVKIQNTGDCELKFYISVKNGDMPASPFTIAPHSEQTIDASLLGDFANFKYIYVFNPDENITGIYTFDLL